MIWSKGERNLVKQINSFFGIEEDDCSILPLGEGKILLTTDTASKSSDFPKGTHSWFMGWYSLAINISDIAGMGGKPLGALLAMTVPDLRKEEFGEILQGIYDCSSAYSIKVWGGDTSYGEELSITGTCVGLASKPLKRRGLKPGDLLAVTGYLGKGGAGYFAMTGDLGWGEKELLRVEPRVEEGLALAKSGSATACMDNSDGLALSLHQLGDVNGVGFKIHEDRLPLYPELLELDIDPVEVALYFGGDFELITGLKREEGGKDLSFTKIIGEVTEKEDGIKMVKRDGSMMDLEERGYGQSWRFADER